MGYTADTAYRYISKQDSSYQTESALILFLKRMINLPERAAKKLHFQKLKVDLIKNEGEHVSAFGLFNLVDWVDRKIAKEL